MKQIILFFLILAGAGLYTFLSFEQTEIAQGHIPEVLGVQTETSPIVAGINDYRSKKGRGPFKESYTLDAIAKLRLKDMLERGYYSHKNPDGETFSALLPKGSGYACENLLLSPAVDTQTVIQEWAYSKSHQDCLLDKRLTTIAVAHESYGTVYMENANQPMYLYVLIASEH